MTYGKPRIGKDGHCQKKSIEIVLGGKGGADWSQARRTRWEYEFCQELNALKRWAINSSVPKGL
jgi:hypothetical protein